MSGPFVSVLIPARNESGHIRACLEAVLEQDYPAGLYEVIVADGLSDDGTREIAQDVALSDPRVRVLDNHGTTVPIGMNLALRASRGEILARVDGRSIVAADYLTRCVETLARTGADGVGGCLTAAGRTAFSRAAALAMSNPFGVGNSAFHYAREEQEADTVYLGAYPRRTFDRFGGYDEAMTRDQDDELNYRIRARGGRIVLNPAIRSVYHPRKTMGALFRQYYQYGAWKPRAMAALPAMISPRHLAPAAFVVLLAVLIILGWPWPFLLAAAGALLLAHALASILFGLSVPGPGLKSGASLALVPAATLCMHLGYGLGSLAGLARLGKRA